MFPSKIKHIAPSILWIVFGAVGVFMTLDYMGPLPSFELGAAFLATNHSCWNYIGFSFSNNFHFYVRYTF